ncbi:ribosomal protein S18 acetylase RimI-like enzyme [Kribbella steppae]|uniref:Ribosomal protein S18 acetylase RimI-like enzyme n=1 Tax=Kribbella steppae TaxID=2512223 RepID=A0A4R2H8R3_9ACTN|nr:GNAT family N-acetyltransferase [Kribbella steppae]TCO23367.1 ribosomal protein S18 acetylase RimI-like enzyme [Kribbella steppae]
MEGFDIRPITMDDAALIAERSGAYTSALLGFAKHSAEDVANYLRDPGFDPGTDGWVVLDADGEFAGSATAAANSDGSRLNLEVLSEIPAVAEWLLERAITRAEEAGRAAGHGEVVLSVGVIRQDEFMPEFVAAKGFAIATSIHRMRITFDGVVEPPPVPAGAVVRRGAFDDPSRRAAHAVLVEAFSTQRGADPRPYEEWAASRESRSTFDWSQLTTVGLDGQAVAVAECNDNFISTDNCGYIGRLAVVPQARGKGLAKFLLYDAFATDAAAGRAGTMLHVDSSNPTPAVGLYTSVGMRPDLISDIWRRTIQL